MKLMVGAYRQVFMDIQSHFKIGGDFLQIKIDSNGFIWEIARYGNTIYNTDINFSVVEVLDQKLDDLFNPDPKEHKWKVTKFLVHKMLVEKK